MDILLTVQYSYYFYFDQSNSNNSHEQEPLLKSNNSVASLVLASQILSPVSAVPFGLYSSNSSQTQDITFQIGLFISWICACLYLTARIPQIFLNHSRKSVQGLSMPMFFCAVMGNTTYALSLLLSDAAVHGGHLFWRGSLPFLLGSAGTLIFDALIFFQSILYTRDHTDDEE